jgi:hypothetical protein
MRNRPSPIGNRQSAIGNQQSAIGNRSLEIGRQQSVFGNRPSAIGLWRSAIRLRPWAIRYRPSVVGEAQSAIGACLVYRDMAQSAIARSPPASWSGRRLANSAEHHQGIVPSRRHVAAHGAMKRSVSAVESPMDLFQSSSCVLVSS